MKQTQVFDYPPNFDAIRERFPAATNKGVIFSYGSVIYNPTRADICHALIRHEAVHGQRQLEQGIEAWWVRYLADPQFRLVEEIHAHHAEYRAALRRQGPGAMRQIAERLSGPLYGRMISYEQAVRAIMDGVLETA
jgi:hypothetical protein